MMRLSSTIALVAAALALAAAAPRAPQPWRDTNRPAAERAAALVKAMTRAEKLAMVHSARQTA